MKRTQRNPISLRASVLGIFFTLWLLVIGGKVVCLQVFQGDWLSKKASDQYEASVRAEGKRGLIYDRNGREMAASIDATSIAADPTRLGDVTQASAGLAKALQINRSSLTQKLSSNKSFVWIQRQVTPKETAAVSALQLGGITFLSEHKRYYPSRTLAAQVLGFTGIDGNGLEGIEYRYNEELNGNVENRTVLQDGKGRGFSAETETGAATDGNNLVLTIDGTVQYIAEQALKEVVDSFQAKSGIAVVMVPETGEILALAHYPFFNPNVYSESEKWKWRNRAITDPFEPGSTLKVFTAAAALETGELTVDSIFFCENGSYQVAGHTIHDTHEYGWMSLQQIIKHSSNIGTAKISERIGSETLYTALRDFGFGDKTGIDCPGETAGNLSSYRKWRGVDALSISFGQGVSVSAVQLAAAVNALANGGVLMRPYVVQAVVDSEGNDVKRFAPQEVRRAISSETAQTITRIMETVTTEGGTGEDVALEGYRVAGKTGTAQKIGDSARYEAGLYVSSFAGFIPAEDPRATIVVVVDEPQTEHYGGTVAGPAFRKIAEELMRYLEVDPSDVPAYSPEIDMEQLTVSRQHGVKG
jgi:cell division protein FtsI (penicillin-binding protein 3)